jgi:RNA polymerase sigma-70 factor (ECF subfamily)
MYSMEEIDVAVISRARAGESEAFRVIVERHSRSVFRLAFRMTGSEQDAEDVVQETFLKAYKRLQSFEARANFGTWLYRIAVNCALDLMRKRRRHEDHNETLQPDFDGAVTGRSGSGASADGMLFSVEVQKRVREAMEILSPMERSAFVLRHYEGMSIEEIGQALGLRTSAAKHSIFRAVKKMRAILEPLMSSIR